MTDPTPLDYQTPPKREPLVRVDIAYVLPMVIFLAFTWLGGHVTIPWAFAVIYLVKAVLTAAALVLLWRQYTRIRWNYWWLGIIVGVIGIVQWIGMQLWLQRHFEFFRSSTGGFNAIEAFPDHTLRYTFYAIRIAGAVLVVPFMEELFWRDFLWRQILAPNDFKLASVGEWAWSPLLIVSTAFATVHGNWWLTAIVWALMVGALLVYTKSLGACIIAHATTNLLLAVYVLVYHDWSFW
jgi:CAAX prenyl protease-like protein